MDKRLVRRLLLDARVSLPVRHGLDTAEVNEVAARYRAGEGIREVAASIGSSYGTVRAALQAAGVPIRPRGGWHEQSPGTVAEIAASTGRAVGLT
jgi:hypothetical protein